METEIKVLTVQKSLLKRYLLRINNRKISDEAQELVFGFYYSLRNRILWRPPEAVSVATKGKNHSIAKSILVRTLLYS